jgi:hypothetical protein
LLCRLDRIPRVQATGTRSHPSLKHTHCWHNSGILAVRGVRDLKLTGTSGETVMRITSEVF